MTRAWTVLVVSTAGWTAGSFWLSRYGSWVPLAIFASLVLLAQLATDRSSRSLLIPRWRDIALGALAGAVLVAVTHGGYWAVDHQLLGVETDVSRLFATFRSGAPNHLIPWLVVVTAVSEEVAFRGTVLDATTDPSLRSIGPKLLMACGLYAITVIGLHSFVLLGVAFGLGATWSLLRLATASLVPSVIAHVLWDLGVFVLWPLEG